MRVIKEASLVLIAVILLYLLSPIGFIISLVLRIFRPGLPVYFRALAISLDKFGNVLCQDLFNLTLIKKGGYTFGDSCDTVSRVLGLNKQTETLSKVGRMLVKVLDFFDPGHVDKAINERHG